MKSAIALLKLIAFLLALQWLCSCNGRHAAIKQIHDYQDSIGIAKLKINLLPTQPGSDAIKERLIINISNYKRIVDSLKMEIQ